MNKNNYKQRYYRYKKLYKTLKKQYANYENSLYNEGDYKSSYYDSDLVESDRVEDIMRIEPVMQFRPNRLDIGDTIDVTIEEEKREQIDIGIYGLARGMVHDRDQYEKDSFIKLADGPGDKILSIDDIDSFDEFTERYGAIGVSSLCDETPEQVPICKKKYTISRIKNIKWNQVEKDAEKCKQAEQIQEPTCDERKFVYIRWDKVEDDYKGFYVNEGLFNDRYSDVMYKDTMYRSWWETEYKFIRGVVIFEVPIYKRYKGYKITKPFKGNIYGENDFPKDNYIIYSDGPNIDKILIIDNIDSFDEFTNKYGFLRDRDKDKEYNISIKWSKVDNDYKGVYIDKDIEIHPVRYKMAFYKGKKYISWWVYYKIKSGTVYIFR